MSGQLQACEEFLAHLERHYDSGTDREAADRHLAACERCRRRFSEMQDRLRDLPCQQFVELVTDYLEEHLPADLRARADQHLRLWEGCRSYLEQMQRTVAMLGRLPADDEAVPEMRAALLAVFGTWRSSR